MIASLTPPEARIDPPMVLAGIGQRRSTSHITRLLQLTKALAAATVSGGLLAITTRLFEIPTPNWLAMALADGNEATAVAMTALGLTLARAIASERHEREPWLRLLLPSVAGAVGLVGWITPSVDSGRAAVNGGTTPTTVAVILLLALAMATLDRPRLASVSTMLAGAALVIGGTALTGHIYEIATLYDLTSLGPLGPYAAANCAALGLGAITCRPGRGVMAIIAGDTAGGAMARQLLPAAILTPIGLGWLLLVGEQSHALDPANGVAVLAISLAFAFVLQIGMNAIRLHRIDLDRIAAHDSARTRAEHLQLMIDNTPGAIAMFDNQMRYLTTSPRWRIDYHLGDRTLLGRSYYEVFPDFPRTWREIHERCLRGETASADEDSFRRADGSKEWLRWAIHPWQDENGAIGGIVIFSEVITARKQAEEALAKIEDQLRQAQKMEAIGRLAGGIAHDFNNLLTVILGYGETALARMSGDDRNRRALDEILRSSRRASELTQQLLAFSRKQVLCPKVLDLNRVVDDVERFLSRLIGENIDVSIKRAADLHRIRADAGQLEQVILNLALNARDAMPNGGCLTIETQNVQLDAAYCQSQTEIVPGSYVLLAISDDGIGMSAETRDRIFEPFFTTKAVGCGTGLGLATVYGIVKQSGAHIWVYSEPGQGSTFKVYFPIVDAELPEAIVNTGSTERGRAQGNETILVVEDDPALRAIICEVLAEDGYTVLAAANGGEAFAIAHHHDGPIHLLITDLIMPGVGGSELARRLAQSRPRTRVLFVSGYTESAIRHQEHFEPGIAFLSKPFTPDGLTAKIRAILDH